MPGTYSYGPTDVPPGRYVSISTGLIGREGLTSPSYAGRDWANTCALTEVGDAVCWPWQGGAGGQPPRMLAGPYAAVSASGSGFCALKQDGEATCTERYGGPPRRFRAIDSGSHTCALTEMGEAVCWGRAKPAMYPPAPAPGSYTAIAVGGHRACALTERGEAVCWTAEPYRVAEPDPAPGRYVAVSGSRSHTCALTEASEAICWGYNTYGQANPPPGRYLTISAGPTGTCAVTDAREAVCWGQQDVGSLPAGRYLAIDVGEGDVGEGYACALTEARESICWYGPPVRIPGRYVAIDVGDMGACGLTDSGKVACWRDNAQGGDFVVADGRYRAVSVGRAVCALTMTGLGTTGDVSCWRPSGTSLPYSPPGVYASVSASHDHACALAAGGEAVCWFYDEDGDDHGQADAPPGRYAAISASDTRTCAVTVAGGVVCWGREHLHPPIPHAD